MKPVTADIMSEIDRRAQEEYGIPQATLMENAGRSVADVISGDLSDVRDNRIAVLCGKGNNGGDGFVITRCLYEMGAESVVVYSFTVDEMRQGSARDNFDKVRGMGVKMKPLEDILSEAGPGFTVLVDALLGTGFKGELKEESVKIGQAVNSSEIKSIYAVDVPSGLNATTGEASTGCIKADKTVTFGLPKKGLFEADGPVMCGEVIVADIGFPKELLEQYQ
ncbi:MAG: NAD(P)H-hydrate epimerase [Candidatus Tantalella remota]|nr:NAD(P)H-hydrate epimerase [Candidatus Tantalella remota]